MYSRLPLSYLCGCQWFFQCRKDSATRNPTGTLQLCYKLKNSTKHGLTIPGFQNDFTMQVAYNAKYPHLFCTVLLLCIVRNAAKDMFLCNGYNSSNPKFESNLNKVLNNLVNNASSSEGFNTSVSGQDPLRVYGLLQCRGDATVEECLSCARDANDSIRQICRDQMGGRTWQEKCYLRYETYSFIGTLDIDARVDHTLGKVTDEPDVFRRAVKELFTNLSVEALRSPILYSSGSSNASTFNTIYSMVQCWRDLTSVEDCKQCLTHAVHDLLNVTVTTSGAYQGGTVGSGSCFARYAIQPFFNNLALASPPPPPPLQLVSPPTFRHIPSSPPTPKKFPNEIAIILGIVAGLLVMLFLCLYGIRRKFNFAVPWRPALLKKENLDTELNPSIGQRHEIVLNLENIKAATRNFHDDNKLGEGGFGTVYKGTMENGLQIAVKKLAVQSLKGKEQFLNEVKLVAKVQHRNLVILLGCCTEGSERLLVYEFLPNNSLDKILFHPKRSKELDWNRRFNIILGVARGLLYLHEDSRLPIIHRDIKASNILLDDKMEPKISDFGLARLFCRDETHVNTRVAGTLGYMAPEYARRGQLSIKADVYSFGVVILEIICGRKNNDNGLSLEFESLVEWVWRSYREGNSVDVIDRAIIESFPNEQISRCIHVGLLCTQANASDRPPMATVYAMLSNPSVTSLPYPTMPAYLTSTTSPATHLVYPSINDASVSDLGSR